MSTSPPQSAASVPLRPWQQFADTAALSIPISISDATYRITQNLRYFIGNYSVLFLIILLLTLISRPLTLIIFLIISTACFYLYLARSEPIELFGFDIDDRIVLGFLGLVTLIALFVAGVWGKVFIAIAVATALSCVHAALRAPEDQEASPYEGLLSVVDDSPRGDYTRV